jgi:hypothetical protein
MFRFTLNREAMSILEKIYLQSNPDDINDEISFVSFDKQFSLSTDQDIKESFDRIVAYFGGFDRAKRIFEFNGLEFPDSYPNKFVK